MSWLSHMSESVDGWQLVVSLVVYDLVATAVRGRLKRRGEQ